MFAGLPISYVLNPPLPHSSLSEVPLPHTEAVLARFTPWANPPPKPWGRRPMGVLPQGVLGRAPRVGVHRE